LTPVLLYRTQGKLSHWNDSFFPAFSKDTHGLAEGIDVGNI
jgi:hypothetical protein